jgi:alcohol dehydrogenase
MKDDRWPTPTLIGDNLLQSDEFASLIAEEDRILVVASRRTRASRPFPTNLLRGKNVQWFSSFDSNPQLNAACKAAGISRDLSSTLIIGVGGGSAIDVAKSARVLPSNPYRALDTLQSGELAESVKREDEPRVIAVSTLAGSGAEVTQFATLYDEGQKYSVDADRVLPDSAVIDFLLATTAPHRPTSAAALDATCHAIESAWSRNATRTSRDHSRRALAYIRAIRWRHRCYTVNDRRILAFCALHAGTAINETRTTAAHAAAYPLTIRYGIPHGVACALNMQWVSKLNLPLLDNALDAKAAIEQGLEISVDELPAYFAYRLEGAGWPRHLSKYGVQKSELRAIADDAARASRMSNNPAQASREEIEEYLSAIY